MDFIKKFWNKIKKPNGFWLVLFYLAFFVFVTITLWLVIAVKKQTFLHYILYFLSATLLTYFVYTMVIFAPKIKGITLEFMNNHKFTRKLLKNYSFRTIFFSVCSLFINSSYVIFQGILTVLTLSPWYFSLTLYNFILALMKSSILLSKRKFPNNEERKHKIYRNCGILLILMTFTFSGCIVLTYLTDMHFKYAGLMIYVTAVYTFYNLTFAIINIFKAKKHDDIYISTIRTINLANSLISIVALQVAMFTEFSPELNKGFANGLTGGAMSIAVIVLGIYMIKQENKIKEINYEK